MSKENKLIIGSIVAVVIMAIGFTYAYFVANIEGDRKNITINMTDLRIIFNGGDTIEGSDLYSEDNFDVVKTFTVENKTKSEYKYNLVIEDLVNTTVTSGSLVYKITCDDSNGYNMTDFEDLPKALTATDTTLAYNIPIASKALQTYTIEIKYINKEDVDQSADMGATLSGKIFIREFSYRNKSLTAVMLEDNPTISERTDFNVANTENTTGTLYKTNKTEDGSDVYYYSGNTTNNWVKFGKETRTSCSYNGVEVAHYDYTNGVYKGVGTLTEDECLSTNICVYTDPDDSSESYEVGMTESECNADDNYSFSSDKATYNGSSEKDIYWRIVRTNEDKSVRLLYSGLDPATTSGYIGISAFNTSYNDPMYVGYMYGTSGSLENNRTNTNDSTIKTYIDTWYENNLLTNYDKYLSKTAIYCNDRSVGSGTYNTGSTEFAFGAYTRLGNYRLSNYTPTYKCGGNGTDGLFESTQAVADKFSVSTTGGGNGQLKYPIALMTADEISFAGGLWDTSLSSPYAWYYTNSSRSSITSNYYWWLLSPYNWYRSYAHVWYADGSDNPGNLNNDYMFFSDAVRPQVSLASCVGIKSGDGTPSYPYVIDESSCS